MPKDTNIDLAELMGLVHDGATDSEIAKIHGTSRQAITALRKKAEAAGIQPAPVRKVEDEDDAMPEDDQPVAKAQATSDVNEATGDFFVEVKGEDGNWTVLTRRETLLSAKRAAAGARARKGVTDTRVGNADGAVLHESKPTPKRQIVLTHKDGAKTVRTVFSNSPSGRKKALNEQYALEKAGTFIERKLELA